jgi:hypothetical protein
MPYGEVAATLKLLPSQLEKLSARTQAALKRWLNFGLLNSRNITQVKNNLRAQGGQRFYTISCCLKIALT